MRTWKWCSARIPTASGKSSCSRASASVPVHPATRSSRSSFADDAPPGVVGRPRPFTSHRYAASMDSQSGSRALGAAQDLVELLRLAASAAERLAQELYGASYEHAELIERELQRVRRSADKLARDVEEYVARAEPAGSQVHPLRRGTDPH